MEMKLWYDGILQVFCDDDSNIYEFNVEKISMEHFISIVCNIPPVKERLRKIKIKKIKKLL
jgi:hypothetical protein